MGDTTAALLDPTRLARYADLESTELPSDLSIVAGKLREQVADPSCPRWITRAAAAVHVRLEDEESRHFAHQLVIEQGIIDAQIRSALLGRHVACADAVRIASLLCMDDDSPDPDPDATRWQTSNLLYRLLDQGQEALALSVTLELLEGRSRDRVNPRVIFEVFHKNRGSKARKRLAASVSELEPNAEFVPILRRSSFRRKKVKIVADFEIPLVPGVTPSIDFPSTLVDPKHPSSSALPKSRIEKWWRRLWRRPTPDLRLIGLRDVYLVGFESGFAVVNPDGTDTGFHSPYATGRAWERIEREKHAVIAIDELSYLGDRFKPNNYAHFLVDYLPRILWLKQHGFDRRFGAFDFEMNSFQKEYLALAGIAEEDLVQLDAKRIYRVKSFVGINSSGIDFKHGFQDGNLAYAKPVLQLAPAGRDVATRATAFVRPGSLGRGLTNSDEVASCLESHGFDRVDPGERSVAEQIEIMQASRVVFGVHGAAMANTVFCRPGTTVIEVFPPSYGTRCFLIIGRMMGLDCRPIVGVGTDRALSVAGAGQLSFELPLGHLEEALDGLACSAEQPSTSD